jgi:hypothetical protein
MVVLSHFRNTIAFRIRFESTGAAGRGSVTFEDEPVVDQDEVLGNGLGV